MSFINNLVNQFAHQGQNQDQGPPQAGGYGQPPHNQQPYGQQQQYGPPQSGGYPPQPYNNERPNPPAPWVAEWDTQVNTWVFINRQSGQRTHDFPHNGQPPQSSGYGASEFPPRPQGYNSSGGYSPQPPGYGQQGGYRPSPPPQQNSPAPAKKDHSGRNTALGVAAGLAGGALLMHEGHKIEERWDEDKYRAEERFEGDKYRMEDRYEADKYQMEDRYEADKYRMEDRYEADKYRMEDRFDNDRYEVVERVEDFPDDAARWTGRKVQEVEDIPENIERRWDDGVEVVEDIPDDIAGWAGRKVGDVERFGDGIEDSYDDGRDEARYDDDYRDDRW